MRSAERAEALPQGCTSAIASVTDREALESALAGADAVVGAYRSPPEDHGEMERAAATALAAARATGVSRLLWLGATGVLRVPGGGPEIVEMAQFPEEWKEATLAHREALRLLRRDGGDLDWTYVSVPRTIEEDGERTGSYRIGVDELLADESFNSRISAEDFAVAVVDLLDRGGHVREHVTFAY